MTSPLVRELVHSLRDQPDRWERDGRYMRRDDGVEIAIKRVADGRTSRPKLSKPREVQFGLVQAFLLRRAIHRWKHRPIER